MNRTKFILITDRVPPEKDNIGAYACYLAQSLREQGLDAEVWSLRSSHSDTLPVRSFAHSHLNVAKMYHLVRALQREDRSVVLWQYNPFLYGGKGLLSLLYLLPLVLKVTTRCRIAIVFHEICYRPGRDPRTWAWAVCQRIALWVSLWGCDVAITTTHPRRDYIRHFAHRLLPRAKANLTCVTVPVGSNIMAQFQPVPATSRSSIIRISIFRFGVSRQDASLLRRLYDDLDHAGLRIQLIFIGGGVPLCQGRPFHHNDEQPGIVNTGYLPENDVSRLLSSVDVFIGWYDDGASGRRTSLAAAFAHGLCVVSTAGSNTDHDLFRHGQNCLLVRHGDDMALQATVRVLCEDAQLRHRLGYCAHQTYQQDMAWPVIAGKVLEVADA